MKYSIALFSYRLLLILLLPILLLVILLRSRKQTAYRQRLPERFGFLNKQLKHSDIVIHAASVGEVLALRPLVETLLKQHVNKTITFTTFTPTGSEQVGKIFGKRVQHCYLPLDFYFANWLFLRQLKPSLIIFMETELWPCLVAQAKKDNCKLMLVNGRLSSSSVKAYQRLKWLFMPCLKRFNKIFTQSEVNQNNFLNLGASLENCQISGNIKYDITVDQLAINKSQELASCISVPKRLWIMASTHQGDEIIALEAFKLLQPVYNNLLLVIVPRHPERFNEVTQLAKSFPFNVATRSSQQVIENKHNVWILDTLGELFALYSIADFVCIGGSFSKVEGHNPLEPAYFKKPIIVGPRMNNFSEITEQLSLNNGLIKLSTASVYAKELANQLTHLIEDSVYSQQLGNSAYKVVQQNQGAVKTTINEINTLLSSN